MKRFPILALAAAVMALSACDPIADAYADRHLKSPTNTIVVPVTGYVHGNRTYTHADEQVPSTAKKVALTTDGKPGYAVCQHYLTSAAGKQDWVLYDDAEVIGTNVDQTYAKHLCMEEGYRIKAGHKPQDLHIKMGFTSNDPSQTIGAARAR